MPTMVPRLTKEHSVSVVIATLGDDVLQRTIAQLNKGTVVPEEILVCIPQEDAYRVRNISFPNLKVIETNIRGQVAQRAIGFNNTSHEIVLQLDDDIFVDQTCIAQLIKTLREKGKNTCVGPVIYNLTTGAPVADLKKRGWIEDIYYWIMNGRAGYIPGAISKAGAGIGISLKNGSKSTYFVEWLAGGCVAYFRENLVLDNFYPLAGKAYCEDLMHSSILTNKGCTLIVDTTARCGIEIDSVTHYSLLAYIKVHLSGYHARKYFVTHSGRSVFRMNILYLVLIINHIINSLIRTVQRIPLFNCAPRAK